MYRSAAARLLWLPALLLVAFAPPVQAKAPVDTLPLWPSGAPGFEHLRHTPEQAKDWWVRSIHNPSLTVVRPVPSHNTGTAVVIAPGGGYRELVYEEEGLKAARYLAKLGVTAFVLKYRLPGEKASPYTMQHPVQDALRALRLVRSRSSQYQINPQRVGMLGFSAGGDLIGRIAYTPHPGKSNSSDRVEQFNARPDFQMLIYPGGEVPRAIPKDSPPAFLLVGAEDEYGCQETTLSLYRALRSASVSVEAHFLAQAKHAFNMGDRSELSAVRSWPQRMADWMQDRGYLSKKNHPTRRHASEKPAPQ